MERTLVIIKPDAINRGLVGEVIHRFERKGLKLVAMKMEHLSEEVLEEHYAHHAEKPFFKSLKEFMQSAPAVLMIWEGKEAVDVVRKLAGETEGTKALPGTVRGDFALSIQSNIIHASDSKETAEKEIKRFFKENEIFSYNRVDSSILYSEGEVE